MRKLLNKSDFSSEVNFSSATPQSSPTDEDGSTNKPKRSLADEMASSAIVLAYILQQTRYSSELQGYWSRFYKSLNLFLPHFTRS